jgi:predicted RNase H-like HicB family nuclease
MAKKLHLAPVIWPEGKRYVSHCSEIGVASFGKSPTAARRALQEAVKLWLSNARKLGLLSEIEPALEKDERYTTSLEVVR